MPILKPLRLIAVVTMLASAPVVLAVLAAALAYAQTAPGDPGQKVLPPSQGPADAVTRKDKDAADNPATKSLVGLPVVGADGRSVGQVRGVKARPDGEISEIHVRVGGLLGFGGKIVAIPAGRFVNAGQSIRLAMTADEVGRLPAIDSPRG